MNELLFHRFGLPVDLVEPCDEVISVIHEVTCLLNTRSSARASDFSTKDQTIVNYGLADFLHFSPLGRQDSQKLADLVYRTIRAFEPRLKLESVIVETPRPCRDLVCAIVTGQVRRRDESMVSVRFPVKVASSTAVQVN